MKLINKHPRITLLCALLSLVIGIGMFTLIWNSPKEARAAIADGHPVFGSSTLVLAPGATNSSTLNMAASGTNSVTGGTATSVPCYNLQLVLAVSSGSVTFDVGAGTGASGSLGVGGTGSVGLGAYTLFPLAANSTSGTTGTQVYSMPMVTNLNQLWIKANNTNAGAAGGGTASVIYTQ